MKQDKHRRRFFQDLNGAVSYRTVKRWCKMIWKIGVIDLSKPSACHRTVHTKAAIQKIKRKSKGDKRISCRKLAFEMDMSFSNAYTILRKDLKMKPYKNKLLNRYWRMSIKLNGKNSPIGREKKFQKEDTMRILFPMKKRLILTVSITVKMIVYGPLIGRKKIGEVKKKIARKISTKSDGMISCMLRGRCAPCSIWKRHSPSSSLHQESTACRSTIRKQSIWKQLDLPTRQRNTTYSPRDARMVLPTFSIISWQRIHGQRIVPIWIVWITAFGTNSLRPSIGIKWHRKVH